MAFITLNFQSARKLRPYIPSCSTIALFVFFLLSLRLNGDFMPLSKRGFFCDDESIRYPVKPDTVTVRTLLFIALIIPCTVIALCDRKLVRPLIVDSGLYTNSTYRRNRKMTPQNLSLDDNTIGEPQRTYDYVSLSTSTSVNNSNGIDGAHRTIVAGDQSSDGRPTSPMGSDTSQSTNTDSQNADEATKTMLIGSSNIGDARQGSHAKRKYSTPTKHKRVQQYSGASEVRVYFLGFVYTTFITGISKISVGRLRPHFYTRCLPNIDCNDPMNQYKYIVDYNCTSGLKPFEESYIQTSWPSGHASIMWFSMLYLSIYLLEMTPILSERFKFIGRLFIPSVQTVLLCLAGYISMSRVMDQHHFPGDVFSGSCLGSLIAILMTQFVDRTNKRLPGVLKSTHESCSIRN